MITLTSPNNKKMNTSHPQAKHYEFKNERGFILELEVCPGLSPSIFIMAPNGESEILFFDWFDQKRAVFFTDMLRQLGMMERTA